MKRFKNILLVIDPDAGDEVGDAPALALAVSLAKRNQARLTLIAVMEDLPSDVETQGSGQVSGQAVGGLLQRLMEDCHQELRSLVESKAGTGIEVRTRVDSGAPFLAIIRQVLREQHDLVMVTTEGEDGLKARLFGSTTMHLMRKCPCPVWAIKPSSSQRFTRILAAVDPSSPDDQHQNLDRLVIDLATSLARLNRSELHVLHAWHLPGERRLRSHNVIPQEQLDELLAGIRASRRARIDELLGHYSSPDSSPDSSSDASAAPSSDPVPRVHLVKGQAASEIPELIRNEGIDLLVMGTVCRTGVAGLFIGNTAESVLANVDCSVLSVKPEGFVTPVTLPEA